MKKNKVSSIQIKQDGEISDKNNYKVEMLDIQASAGPGVMVLDDFIETITAIEYSADEAKRLFGGRSASTIKMITVKGDSMAGTF